MGIVNQAKHGKPAQNTGAPVVTRLVEEDNVSWVRKPHLRSLYLLLVPAAIGIEITSGFDSQLINALQIVPAWIKCKKATILGYQMIQGDGKLTEYADSFPQPPRFAQGYHRCRIFPRCYSFVAFHSLGR